MSSKGSMEMEVEEKRSNSRNSRMVLLELRKMVSYMLFHEVDGKGSHLLKVEMGKKSHGCDSQDPHMGSPLSEKVRERLFIRSNLTCRISELCLFSVT